MTKINFTAIPVSDIEGNQVPTNVAQAIGNLLFSLADDVAEYEFGIEIYHSTGDIDLDEKKEAILKKFLPVLKYNLRKSLSSLLFHS